MPATGLVWLEFALCASAIGYAGARLSRYGDVIAEKTGIGGSWIGLILVATVTSLPELASGVSAVTVAGAPNIAIGDALGSCVFNLLIIVVLDVLSREESIYTRASLGHVLSAAFGAVLIGFVGFSLLVARGDGPLALGHVGVYSPMIALVYFMAMRTVFQYERRERAAYVEEAVERYPSVTLRMAAARYAAAAVVVVAAGIWLPFLGVDLARLMGWHNTFVGTIFVAAATSLPELAVSVAAVRIGAIDMAIANLLGSNLFNMLVIAIDDLAYLPGPILAAVSPAHAVSALSAVMMSGVAIVGLFYRSPGRVGRTAGWASLMLLAVYLLNVFVLYLHDE